MDILQIWEYFKDPTVMIIGTLFVLSFLISLYAIALLNSKLRVIHEELIQLTDDNRLLNESIRFLQANMSNHGEENEQPPSSQTSAL